MLMRPDRVVPKLKFIDRGLQTSIRMHTPLIQLRLQSPEKTFDPAVHPRTSRNCKLPPNSDNRQYRAKTPAAKHRLVVSANRTRLAETVDCQKQLAEDRPS